MFDVCSSAAASPTSKSSANSTSSFSILPTDATSSQMSLPTSTFSSSLDPRLLGLNPKMLQGLDEKALKSLGLDQNNVKSLLTDKCSGIGGTTKAYGPFSEKILEE